MLDAGLRARLLLAEKEDRETRARLAATGALFEGYNPESAHLKNAAMLEEIFDAIGWPGAERVGEDGMRTAFLILQHAISRPQLMRRGLALLEAQGGHALEAAYLSDRIASLEGRPQRFGTQFDWDAAGKLSPLPIEDPEGVEERRARVGLEPLAQRIATMRAGAAAEGDQAPADRAARRAAQEAWARRVGWRA